MAFRPVSLRAAATFDTAHACGLRLNDNCHAVGNIDHPLSMSNS
jgi:hypothetical protein